MTRAEMPEIDFRRRRAEALASALMLEVEGALPVGADKEKIYYAIFDALHRNGACWTTDEEREKMGLEPRDVKGWTASERIARRIELAEIMMSQISQIYIPTEPKK